MHKHDGQPIRSPQTAEDVVGANGNAVRMQICKQGGVSTVSLVVAGGIAEWSMAVVLKTTKVQAFGGSNPSPSATIESEVQARIA